MSCLETKDRALSNKKNDVEKGIIEADIKKSYDKTNGIYRKGFLQVGINNSIKPFTFAQLIFLIHYLYFSFCFITVNNILQNYIYYLLCSLYYS